MIPDEKLRKGIRRLYMAPGTEADVTVILHDTWRLRRDEFGEGLNIQFCDCHDWTDRPMITGEPE